MKYSVLSQIYHQLESTSKTLDKTKILADFLKNVKSDELEEVILLIQGRAFPEYDSNEIGIGAQLTIKAIASASGVPIAKVNLSWKQKGDLGETAEELISNKKQATLFSKTLTTNNVLTNLQKLAGLEGAGTVDKKVSLIKELLTSAQDLSAKYIIRTALGDLRIGVGEGVLRDAISQAFSVDKEAVQRSYNLTTDFGEVAQLAKTGGSEALKKSKIVVGHPLKVMLYQKVHDIPEAFERVGKPAAFEYKYDGFRLQIHKKGSQVWLFTRRQEDVTNQFPDVVDIIKKRIDATSFIMDSEIIGLDIKTGKWLPFQNISQRIKRKYGIIEMIKKIPVIINVFDIIYLNGKNVIHKPYGERYGLIKKTIKPIKNKLNIAKQMLTTDPKEAEEFYKESLRMGNEGIMVKNLDAEYKPGSRVGYGVKVKPIMDSLDLVIVGAEWGTGKRGGWLSSYVLACVDRDKNEFLEMGKLGTGIKEKAEMGTSFQEFTTLLKPLIIKESGKTVTVKPEIVIEVAYEEIQKSPTYGSGYALRFPRLTRLRNDRRPEEADDIKRVKDLFRNQRGQK
jgi:DNA ligase 1